MKHNNGACSFSTPESYSCYIRSYVSIFEVSMNNRGIWKVGQKQQPSQFQYYSKSSGKQKKEFENYLLIVLITSKCLLLYKELE